MIDKDVRDPRGRTIGWVEDVLFEASSGKLLCMIVAAKAPDVASKIRKRATLLGASVLIGVIIYGIVYFYPVLISALPLLGIVVVVHNAVAFATGAAAGRVLSQLKGLGGAAAIAAVWGVWDLVAGGAIAAYFRAMDKARATDYDAEATT